MFLKSRFGVVMVGPVDWLISRWEPVGVRSISDIVASTLILPWISPSFVIFGVTGMAAINKSGCLMLNEFEVSYLITPSSIRHLQGSVCNLRNRRRALFSRSQIPSKGYPR